jgi:hypothetical protein
MSAQILLDHLLFMKIGGHGDETLHQILERKRKEYNDTGISFWGYGGTACHPLKQVRPFALETIQTQPRIYMLMKGPLVPYMCPLRYSIQPTGVSHARNHAHECAPSGRFPDGDGRGL